jgi:hypothetical protein
MAAAGREEDPVHRGRDEKGALVHVVCCRDPRALSQGLVFLLVVGVVLIGIVVQADLRGQPPRRGAPGRCA